MTAPTIDLQGRVALITGAAGGIGQACARRAVDAGAKVALCDLSTEMLVPLQEELGDSAQSFGADLTDEHAAPELVAAVVEHLGRLDVVLACAGVMQTKPLDELTAHEWRRMLEVNLVAAAALLPPAAAAIEEGGAIVLFSSVAGRSGRPMAAHYAASKTALLSLTKSSAMAYAPHMRVNAVCPGVVLTKMWDEIIADRDRALGAGAGEAYRQQVEEAAPLGRSGSTTEIADAVLFLASPLASYVTGQALNVDGGLEMN